VDEQELRKYLRKLGIKSGLMRESLLRGYRRVWNVAMDNRKTIEGYKFYRDPQSGQQPGYFVTFLNIYPSDVTSVNGIAFEVPQSALAEFDRRERNYRRIDVSDRIEPRLEGKVWTYIATDDGLARYKTGEQDGTAVIDDEYATEVERAFRSRGDTFYGQYVQSTDAPGLPRRQLKCIEVP